MRCRLLGIGTVGDGEIIAWREFGLEGSRVDVAGEDFINVSWHGHATRAFGLVPVKVHAGNFGTLAVLSDGVVLLEDVTDVTGVAFIEVFNAKVIDNEGE